MLELDGPNHSDYAFATNMTVSAAYNEKTDYNGTWNRYDYQVLVTGQLTAEVRLFYHSLTLIDGSDLGGSYWPEVRLPQSLYDGATAQAAYNSVTLAHSFDDNINTISAYGKNSLNYKSGIFNGNSWLSASSTLTKGTFVVNLTVDDMPLENDWIQNTLRAMKNNTLPSNGTMYDVNKDGVWDVEKYTGGEDELWMARASTCTLDGIYYTSLSAGEKQALQKENVGYFSRIAWAFSGSAACGEYTIQLPWEEDGMLALPTNSLEQIAIDTTLYYLWDLEVMSRYTAFSTANGGHAELWGFSPESDPTPDLVIVNDPDGMTYYMRYYQSAYKDSFSWATDDPAYLESYMDSWGPFFFSKLNIVLTADLGARVIDLRPGGEIKLTDAQAEAFRATYTYSDQQGDTVQIIQTYQQGNNSYKLIAFTPDDGIVERTDRYGVYLTFPPRPSPGITSTALVPPRRPP